MIFIGIPQYFGGRVSINNRVGIRKRIGVKMRIRIDNAITFQQPMCDSPGQTRYSGSNEVGWAIAAVLAQERKVRTPQGRVTANSRTQQVFERTPKARNRATETSKRRRLRGRETR